jgi:aspartate/methionine/tyrosine aminotransferase
MSDGHSPHAALADLGRLIHSPFARLRTLLQGVEPGMPPIDMTIGEPRHGVPAFLAGLLAEKIADYGRYPPIQGTPELLAAIAGWLVRRYPALAGAIEPARHILPLTGSREGLFSAVFPAMARRAGRAERQAVLMPNPFYQAYLAGALAGGGEPVFLNAAQETGFLPDLDALPPELLARTAVLYLASPANPQGAIASRDYLARAITLARRHDFMLFVDECYSEIWYDSPPAGALEAAFGLGGDFVNVAVLNSLSKRSNVPGLRSGFIAGDAAFLADYARFRNVACPQMPLPVQHASAALWRDEAHVEESRARYAAKLSAAGRILGRDLSAGLPDGAFFLWLKVEQLGGGEAAATTFWKGCGVKVLPGAYLAQADAHGRNPGGPYVRIALVHELAPTVEALERLASLMS